MLEHVLGAGSFGVVLQVVEKKTGGEFAMKLISKKSLSESSLEHIINETKMLAQIDHPNVVKLRRVHDSKDFIILVMELVKSGTLDAFMQYRYLKFDLLNEEEVSSIIRQVLGGVSYFHNIEIIHRDLKPQNILMKSFYKLEGTVKIADFGLGMKGVFADTGNCGTQIYMAPEQLLRQRYTRKVDIWAVGLIMFELLAGHHPFYEKTDTIHSFSEKIFTSNYMFPTNFSELAKDFFGRMCSVNIDGRYCANMALKHPWITRKLEDNIPLTIFQENTLIKIRKDLVQEITAIFFAAQVAIEAKSQISPLFEKMDIGRNNLSKSSKEHQARDTTFSLVPKRIGSPVQKKKINAQLHYNHSVIFCSDKNSFPQRVSSESKNYLPLKTGTGKKVLPVISVQRSFLKSTKKPEPSCTIYMHSNNSSSIPQNYKKLKSNAELLQSVNLKASEVISKVSKAKSVKNTFLSSNAITSSVISPRKPICEKLKPLDKILHFCIATPVTTKAKRGKQMI